MTQRHKEKLPNRNEYTSDRNVGKQLTKTLKQRLLLYSRFKKHEHNETRNENIEKESNRLQS